MLILKPAQTVIELCGGDSAVAKLADRDVSRVRRWSWPREKGGTDGIIPMDVMLHLLSVAPENGIRGLTADHFTKGANTLSRDDLRVLALLMDGECTAEIASRMGISPAQVDESQRRLRASLMVAPEVWDRVERRQAKSVPRGRRK